MEIIFDETGLKKYIQTHGRFILDGPILVDKFLEDAVEVDVDALCDGKDVFIAGVMQHIEEAGIHSGDSACSLPPYSLSQKMIAEIKEATIKLALKLEVVGLMNVQYAIKDEQLYIIEVNPRASRTAPFVAKATGINIAKIASLLMVGQKLASFGLDKVKNYADDYFSVKEVVLPFARFANVDTLLGPEMKSTGEVMGIDKSFEMAFLKAQLAVGNKITTSGNLFFSIADRDKKHDFVELIAELQKNDFKISATIGTGKFLAQNGIKNIEVVLKEQDGGYNVVDMIKEKKFDVVINTAYGAESNAKSFNLRRAALMNRVFYITTMSASKCFVAAVKKLRQEKDFDVFCLQKL
jgi:carbamoyl-phosphate synthase large subunit